MSKEKLDICAVVTSYKPSEEMWSRYNLMLERLRNVVIVDNTPGGTLPSENFSGVFISKGVNRGLGAALNNGIHVALEMGCKWIVLFDQDSDVPSEFFSNMLRECEYIENHEDSRIAAISPMHMDDLNKRVSVGLRHRIIRKNKRYYRVNSVITSGMLIFADTFRHVGKFNEDLFLDFVDHEWCWRAKHAGYTFFKSQGVFLPHRLGLEEKNCLGLRYHIPAEYRHYFQFRDTLNLLFLSYAPLYDRLRLLVLLPLKLFCYPFILDNGSQRLGWMLLGLRDWVLRKKGIGAAKAIIG
jgi:rhamnosyltransferase